MKMPRQRFSPSSRCLPARAAASRYPWKGPSAMVAAPPPMMPLMPWRTMKSSPRARAAAQAEDHAAPGEDVGDGVVLGEAQRVPHGRDVEAAADLDPPGDVGEVDRVHQEIGDDLVALVLEVVLGEPDRVVARLV